MLNVFYFQREKKFPFVKQNLEQGVQSQDPASPETGKGVASKLCCPGAFFFKKKENQSKEYVYLSPALQPPPFNRLSLYTCAKSAYLNAIPHWICTLMFSGFFNRCPRKKFQRMSNAIILDLRRNQINTVLMFYVQYVQYAWPMLCRNVVNEQDSCKHWPFKIGFSEQNMPLIIRVTVCHSINCIGISGILLQSDAFNVFCH